MNTTDTTRPRYPGRARPLVLLAGLTLLLTACFDVTVPTAFGDITFVICDYRDLPLGGIQVEIDGTVKTTDADGRVEFGTVQLPYDANIYDAANDLVLSYQNVDVLDLRLFMPFSDGGTADGGGAFSGSITPLFGGDHDLQVGATVDGKAFAGSVDQSSLDYSVDARWRLSAAVGYDLYAVDLAYTPDPDVVPGIVNEIGIGYDTGSIGDGADLTVDLDVLSHAQGSITGNVAVPSGFEHTGSRYGAVLGSMTMNAGVAFEFQHDMNPSTSFSFPSVQVPASWSADFFVNHHFANSAGEEVKISRAGIAYNDSPLDIFAAQLGTAFLGYDDNDTFDEGDSVDVGSLVQDTTVSLRLDAVTAGDPSIWIFSDTGALTIPDLSPFGLTLRAGSSYRARTVRYDWSFEALLSKLFDPDVLVAGISFREDLTTLHSEFGDIVVAGGGGGGGVTPPTSPTFFQAGSLRWKEGLSLSATFLPEFIAPQAASCPQLGIAASEGSVVVDACDGTVLKTYPAGPVSYFDAHILPVPPGETGDPSLFQSGTGYFLAALDENGDTGFGQINPPGSGPFIDSVPIGDDAANGVSFIDAQFGSIGFVVFDSGTGSWVFDPLVIDPFDLNDGTFDHTARSAIVNPAGDRLLVVGRRTGGDNSLHLLHVTLDTPVALRSQAVASVAVVGPLGSDPRRVRCDFVSERCAVSDRSDDTVTVIAWDGSTAPSITGTAAVAAGPVGIDVLGDRIVSAGYDDDHYSVISLETSGSVAGVATTALPGPCNAPGHALFLDDPGNGVIVSCNGDGTAADPGGYVYIPGAF